MHLFIDNEKILSKLSDRQPLRMFGCRYGLENISFFVVRVIQS